MRRTCLLLVALLAAAAAFATTAAPSSAATTITGTPEPISWASGHIDVFAPGSDNALWLRTYDNGVWQRWASLGSPGDLRSRPSAVTWGPGHLDVFVRGPGDYLYHRWLMSNGQWSSWTQRGSVPFQGNPKAISRGNGHIEVFVRDTANKQRSIAFTSACGGWCASYRDFGGTLSSDPEPISVGAGHMAVFSRASDNRLQYVWQDNNVWDPTWRRLPDVQLTGGPEAVTWGPQHIGVFARGLNNQMVHIAWANNVGGWQPWQDLGGGLASDGISGVSFGDGHFAIYATGTNNAVHDRWYQQWAGGWGPWWQVSGNQTEQQVAPGTHARAVSWGSGHIDVFWRGGDGTLRHRWYTAANGWYSGTGPSLGMPVPDGGTHRFGVAVGMDSDNYENGSKGVKPFADHTISKLSTRTVRIHAAWDAADSAKDPVTGLFVEGTEGNRVEELINEAHAAGHEVLVTIGRNFGNRTIPSTATYETKVGALVNRFHEKVTYWGPVNEPNAGDAWLGGQYTTTGPQIAAGYYNAMIRRVAAAKPTLTPEQVTQRVTGPDLHDDRGSATAERDWLNAYWAAGGRFGVAATFHPYGAVQYQLPGELTDYRDAVAQLSPNSTIWLTEIGAYRRNNRLAPDIFNDLAGQDTRLRWLLDQLKLPTMSPRFTRMYYYFPRDPYVVESDTTAESAQNLLDSGLANGNGSQRPAWFTYCEAIQMGNCT